MSGPEGIEKLIRPYLAGFTGYSAATSPETLEGRTEVAVQDIIKLDANENPYGCSPRVLRALAESHSLNIYPDDGQQVLRGLLAGYAGAPAEKIVAGHGSNTLIDLVVRLFVGEGDEVINCVPTFDLYRFSTDICGGTVVNVERDGDFNINVKAVIRAISPRTKLIFFASPNNPTGNAVPPEGTRQIVETGVPVVVDEAYYEFCGDSVIKLTETYPNLMVLRSFSKWAGLAGLRVGYGIFPPRVAAYLLAIKVPYSVSMAGEIAARESLADLDYLHGKVEAIIEERGRLMAGLESISWLRPYPSQANFIYCAVLEGRAAELHQELQRKGILVRYFDRPLLRNSIRVSVGKPEHTDALLKALRALRPA
jgi:histidinol-phosphate aminotransferase